MIIYLSRGAARLAFRLRNMNTHDQLISWNNLCLHIRPGQYDQPCGPNGSPWVLTGCWPGKPTGVDIANPQPYDFPTKRIPAFKLDADGRVVFRLPPDLWELPNGRYTGCIIAEKPGHDKPFNFDAFMKVMPPPPEKPEVVLPPGYDVGKNCDVRFDSHPPEIDNPAPCILAIFDIDIGPECSDHYADQVVVEMARITCEE